MAERWYEQKGEVTTPDGLTSSVVRRSFDRWVIAASYSPDVLGGAYINIHMSPDPDLLGVEEDLRERGFAGVERNADCEFTGRPTSYCDAGRFADIFGVTPSSGKKRIIRGLERYVREEEIRIREAFGLEAR